MQAVQKNRGSSLPADGSTFKPTYVPHLVVFYIVLHCIGVYGLYLGLMYGNWRSWIFAYVGAHATIGGIAMGTHRFYSHRSFKAHWSVRLVLTTLHVMSGQNTTHTWVRDHRAHHKYTDTDADPHSISRGFFFSHIGWLMMRKHPAVIAAGKKVDMSDLEADPMIMFQKRYFFPLFLVVSVAVPMAVPMYFWNESFLTAFCFCFMARFLVSLHVTNLFNSAAHMYGHKPYDKNISAGELFWLNLLALGEGWHNYHHAFPTDYRSSELGVRYNTVTIIIDFLARLGLVHDLKTMSGHLVKQRMQKTGDGHQYELTP